MPSSGRSVVTSGAGGQVERGVDVGRGGASGESQAAGPAGDPASDRLKEEFRRHQADPNLEREQHESLSLWVDPLQRALAQPLLSLAPSAAPPVPQPALPMDEMARAVRRIAWGGDRQRSIAYIELAAGELSGATLTLEARGKAVSVMVEVPVGTSTAGWAERLTERLTQRGLEVESVEVR